MFLDRFTVPMSISGVVDDAARPRHRRTPGNKPSKGQEITTSTFSLTRLVFLLGETSRSKRQCWAQPPSHPRSLGEFVREQFADAPPLKWTPALPQILLDIHLDSGARVIVIGALTSGSLVPMLASSLVQHTW